MQREFLIFLLSLYPFGAFALNREHCSRRPMGDAHASRREATTVIVSIDRLFVSPPPTMLGRYLAACR